MSYLDPVFLLLMAGTLAAITAIIHSVLGEQRLIRPMLAMTGGIFESPLARQVTRFAWHWTSVLWLLVAAVLGLTAYGLIASPELLWAIGGAHLVMGLADGLLTRGQHIGWPLITLIGVLTLLSVYLTQ